ncbi:MAG: hypothetical protein ACOYOB_17375, partial [Myxococcota bacterium]
MVQRDLSQDLKKYGADPGKVLYFGGDPQPGHLRYLDLSGAPPGQRPDAVVQDLPGRALVYVLDARDRLPPPEQIATHRRLLSLRGEAAYLAVVRPGRLDVYEVALDAQMEGQRPVLEVTARERAASSALPRLLLSQEPG